MPEEGNVDGEDAQAHCRICHQTAEESSEPLIMPCRCAGSIQHAHAKCILKWLEYSGQAVSSKYRCDICRAKFRVTLGGGKPPGCAYLRRDVDVFHDPGFDAPGLVAAIFLSFVQTLATTLGRGFAQSIHGCAVVFCSLFPTWIGGWLLVGLEVPVLCLELVTWMFYLFLLCVKGTVVCWGPKWRPTDWGDFGAEHVTSVLAAVVENFFALGFRLDSVLILAIYFQVVHICSIVGGHSLTGMLVLWVLGEERAQHLSAFDPGLKDLFPAFERLFPGTAPLLFWYVHLPAGVVSLSFNLTAIAGLLKRAFFDSRPMPVDILPATDSLGGVVARWPFPCSGQLVQGAVAAEDDRRAEDSKKDQ